MGFKQFYLTEVSLIDIKEFVFSAEEWIPLSTKMLQRVFGKKRKTVYHSTSPFHLFGLAKLQGTKKSISAFTDLGSKGSLESILKSGIATGGGVIVELEGNILLDNPSDAFSSTDKQGRRWVPVSELGDLKLRGELKSKVRSLRNSLFKKHIITDFPSDKIITTDTVDPMITADKKKISGFIRDYFTGVEKILSDKLIKNLFISISNQGRLLSYNEVIVNQIQIKTIYVLTPRELEPEIYQKFKVISVDTSKMDDLFNKIKKAKL